jgi:hypothetical protein
MAACKHKTSTAICIRDARVRHNNAGAEAHVV